MTCYLDQEVPCRFSAATPEELGIWLTEGKSKHPFNEWLRIHRTPPAVPAEKSGIIVHPSVSDVIRQSTENPKRTQTVPVTVETSDGQKWVVGEAQVEVRDGWFRASMNLNRDSMRVHALVRDVGPFSITNEGARPSPADLLRADGVIPLEPRIKRMCLDSECEYIETHQHGAACTRNCHCNRNGRSD